ncbi:MAG: hypothetical protein H0U15_12320 [Geodermatophilaceae bacterium]|jgi:hypothetical protein|nr:hypothetical protein [Geodermatophilaceae bacterium]
MTQPGAPDPSSQPPYGQQNQPPSGNYPDSGSAGYGQPAQTGSGQPGGYPSGPPSGYGAPSKGGTPPQVITAAVLGFIAALLTLLATFGFFALSSFSGIFVIFAILYLAITAGLIAGGVMALTGKTGQILLITAAVATGLQILGIIFSLVQGQQFSALSLIGLVLTGGIVFLLLQPVAKQFFSTRR